MGLAHRSHFSRKRPRLNAAWAAVIAHTIDVVIVDRDVMHIHVLDDRGVHIGYGTVVVEVATVPVTAIVAVT